MANALQMMRDQFMMNNIALALFASGWYIFFGGLIQSIRYTIQDYRKPVPYLCAFQCALGLISTSCYVAAIAPCVQAPCSITLMFSHITYALSYMSVLGILLMKSYFTNRRNQFILYTGSGLLIMNIIILIYAGCVMEISEEGFGCLLDYGETYNILKLITDLLTHSFLSISILTAVWWQLHAADRIPDVWLFYQILLEDGLIYGLSVCMATCIGAIIALRDLMGDYTSIIYAINWVLVSALVSHQLRTARIRASQTVYFTQHAKSITSTPRRGTMDTCNSPRSRSMSVSVSVYTARPDSYRSSVTPTTITGVTLTNDCRVIIPEDDYQSIPL
ncbi:hypothetical protein BDF19DRAFT_458448 [Syncephalis fuscata]|nr:hypothetical protein BDF19DRAFT_458448 [Syncephalis fuscata]